jgi:spore coat polysaccharide biosynthesis protein SpsF
MSSVPKRTGRVVAVIQARMGSTRLPGKVLADLDGRPVLAWVVDAAKAAQGVDIVVVATSVAESDNEIAQFCADIGVRVIRGSEQDVLARFLKVAEETEADGIVRLTADCPLLDPDLIAQVVALWRGSTELDYVSTTLNRSLPRGLDVEIMSVAALQQCNFRAEAHHRTHVTSALYEEGSGFQLASLSFFPNYSGYRVTLDTFEDLKLLRVLAPLLAKGAPSWREIVRILDRRPDIAEINAHVEQKTLIEG